MEKILHTIKKIIPRSIFSFFQPTYHFLWAFLGALVYRFPSRNITVIGVTGTKGKSSTTEFLNAALEAGGKKTAIVNGIRFKIVERSTPNKFKMTMPGRMFIQKKIREAVDAKCEYFILEITSEGAKQFRHKFIDLDALIFTNLSPEHIESHGSYENYRDAKLSIAHALENSPKKNRVIIANMDDKEGPSFLNVKVETRIPFSLKNAEPYHADNSGLFFTFDGEKISYHLPGTFNIYNALAAAICAKHFGVSAKNIAVGIKNMPKIRGRMEKIDEGQPFDVYVDYAHTADSLKQAYEALADSPSVTLAKEGKNLICVLGSTGGGRDKWKRPEMGAVADAHCSHIILTNEDPYDEDPETIIKEVAGGIKTQKPEIIMDRRDAIREAFSIAKEGDAVIITGKGTDPYIMEANGEKTPWDDAKIAREDLKTLGHIPRN
ncbi:MAG: UDP-N-acetylmuramyl-tripeptide synthetase [Candidatus Paceibacterota bacterium]|jgi:UDP-N-acetylmuramoyl-L-alanyl-D-glutamate--2,6-diaminopimelate ligase|nr:UDP-N-acetylmuramyl-tripeptide synthetase [Candidatus Paceibacterota bacterium]